MKHKSRVRQARRRAYRETVALIQKDTGSTREEAANMLAATGASWRDYGLAYTGFGEAILGPPIPAGVERKLSWVTDGIPVGRRAE